MSQNLVMWETPWNQHSSISQCSCICPCSRWLPTPASFPCPPLISCWVDEWETNMDQTQTRQTAAPPSHPIPSQFTALTSSVPLDFPVHLFSFLFQYFRSFFFSFTLILSILCLLNGCSTCRNGKKVGKVINNIKRKNEQQCQRTEWKEKND